MLILDEATLECAFQLVNAHTYPGSEIVPVRWDKNALMAEDVETRIFSPDFLQYDSTSFVESAFENGLHSRKRVQALLDEKMWREIESHRCGGVREHSPSNFAAVPAPVDCADGVVSSGEETSRLSFSFVSILTVSFDRAHNNKRRYREKCDRATTEPRRKNAPKTGPARCCI